MKLYKGSEFVLSKEQFVEIMDKFEKQYRKSEEWVDKIYTLFGGIDPIYEYNYLDLCIDILEKAMGCDVDDVGYTWISWWMFEDDFGKNEWVVEVNGKKYTPVTHEELYELIAEDNK